jgi:hypothetical protein
MGGLRPVIANATSAVTKLVFSACMSSIASGTELDFSTSAPPAYAIEIHATILTANPASVRLPSGRDERRVPLPFHDRKYWYGMREDDFLKYPPYPLRPSRIAENEQASEQPEKSPVRSYVAQQVAGEGGADDLAFDYHYFFREGRLIVFELRRWAEMLKSACFNKDHRWRIKKRLGLSSIHWGEGELWTPQYIKVALKNGVQGSIKLSHISNERLGDYCSSVLVTSPN